jgi:hypothetical protein
MTLIDTDVVRESEQDVKVFMSPVGVSVFADGYGTSGRILSPLFITQQKGELLVFVNGDINVAGATHVIRLGKAKETNRRRPVMDTR